MFADIAGVQLPSQRKHQMKEDRSFEAEMENELDASFRRHNAEWRGGPSAVAASTDHAAGPSGVSKKKKPGSNKASSSSEADRKKPRKEEDVDPALGLNDQGTESDEGKKSY